MLSNLKNKITYILLGLTIFFLIIFFACRYFDYFEFQNDQEPLVSPEEYQIYEEALKNWKPSNYEVSKTWNEKQFIVQQEIGIFKKDNLNEDILYSLLHSIKSYPDLQEETALNYFGTNLTKAKLSTDKLASNSYRVLSKGEYLAYLEKNMTLDSRKFAKTPIGTVGILNFSRVGFNRIKDQAITLIEYSDGPLSGEGCMLIFKKYEGVWTLAKSIRIWVS